MPKPFKIIGLFLIVIAFSFLLTAFAALAFAGTVSDWEEYTDNELHVVFRHPREWKSSTLYGDTTNFGGPDGSLQVDASKGDNPEQVCRGAASHKLQPYGTHPQIKPIEVDGQKGCVVWPSDDQGAPWYAELVVPFPRRVEIKGERWPLLTIYADKKHFVDIVKTVKFLRH